MNRVGVRVRVGTTVLNDDRFLRLHAGRQGMSAGESFRGECSDVRPCDKN